MKMAKVITLKIKMSRKFHANLVVTVDPVVTPEMVCIMAGIRGQQVKSESSAIMPLTEALALCASKKRALGIC